MLIIELNKTITKVLEHYNDNYTKSERGIRSAAFRKWMNELDTPHSKIAEMYLDGIISKSHSKKVAMRKQHTGAKQMHSDLSMMTDSELANHIDKQYEVHLDIFQKL